MGEVRRLVGGVRFVWDVMGLELGGGGPVRLVVSPNLRRTEWTGSGREVEGRKKTGRGTGSLASQLPSGRAIRE